MNKPEMDTPIYDTLNAEMDGTPKVWDPEWSAFKWNAPNPKRKRDPRNGK